MVPEVNVSWNQNLTLLVTFSPNESIWKFPKNNKLKLFNTIHWRISQAELRTGEQPENIVMAVTQEIQAILTEWIDDGDLIIE